jgi:iron(III) transport system substrate-binding protein
MNRTTHLLPRLGILLALLVPAGCTHSQPRVVLYCAQDEDFAKGLLQTFRERTGLEAVPKFDTEAGKSVELYLELVQEKARPRCDVFWNNEILSTIRLQRQGMLEPYASPSAKPYPAWCHPEDPNGQAWWNAFAARPRILIVNTKRVKEADRPRSILDLTKPEWKGRVAMANPLFGTTATQAACLFEVLGKEKAEEFYRGLHQNGVQIAPGNRNVAAWVGEGRAAVGLTDPDDAFEEMHDHPDSVAIVFPDSDAPKDGRMGTVFLPNTVAIIKGGPNPEGARKLVDYLLSAEIETKLAEGPSHQVPLNPEVKVTLPKEVDPIRAAKRMDVDWGKAADLWDEVQTFLRKEFAQ